MRKNAVRSNPVVEIRFAMCQDVVLDEGVPHANLEKRFVMTEMNWICSVV